MWGSGLRQVSLDTASFEVVRNCWHSLVSLLEEGLVDLLLCNEDEALAVAEASSHHAGRMHMLSNPCVCACACPADGQPFCILSGQAGVSNGCKLNELHAIAAMHECACFVACLWLCARPNFVTT